VSDSNGTASATAFVADHRGAGIVPEQTVIAALLTATGQYADVPGRIRSILAGPTDFVQPRNALIYELILKLAADGLEHSTMTVIRSMDEDLYRRTGGVEYLTACMENGLSVGSAVDAAYALRKAAALRDLAKLGATATLAARASALDDADEAISRIKQMAEDLRSGARPSAMTGWNSLAVEVIEEVERIGTLGPDEVAGASTGWVDVDRLLGGVSPGSQVILAGRPGIGKSVAGRGWAYHGATKERLPWLFFSLEMPRIQVGMAMLAADAAVPFHLMRSGRLSGSDWEKVARSMQRAEDAPLLIDDTPSITVDYVASELERAKQKYGQIGGYVIDYLQLVSPVTRSFSREQDVAGMSREFKKLTMRHGCVGILISQLNRGPEGRTDKRPVLSDLRESGSIEQDADIVILLHRDDYYDKESPRAGEADFIVAKNRHGATDTITLAAQLHLARFKSMEMA
jgi:replicative DNA helicase